MSDMDVYGRVWTSMDSTSITHDPAIPRLPL